MITIKLSHYDRDTEIAITEAKSGISSSDAERAVDLVRGLREQDSNGVLPSVRACIMLGKIMNLSGTHASAKDENFIKSCLDILDSETDSTSQQNKSDIRKRILDLINKVC